MFTLIALGMKLVVSSAWKIQRSKRLRGGWNSSYVFAVEYLRDFFIININIELFQESLTTSMKPKTDFTKKPRGQRGHPASRDIGLISPILAYYKNKKDKMHYWCFTCLDKLTKAYQTKGKTVKKKIFPDPDNIHTVLVPPFVIL